VDPLRLTLAAARARLQRGELRPLDLVEAVLVRAESVQHKLHAFLWLDPDRARAEARRVAHEGPSGPLWGIPVTLKDLIAEEGAPFTCGSGRRSALRADRDAEVTRRLREAGVVFVGRAHLHEFAYGVTNENPHFGPARNPWDPERSPGGSSGGSAVAVATGCALASLGTDTGGSVRIPAALCGVVGFKPTYGLVPRKRVFPLAPSLDHVGPLGRTVEDVALVLEVLVGAPGRYTAGLSSGVGGLRVGVPGGPFWELAAEGVLERFEEAVRLLERQGARRVDVDFPWEPASAAATAILMVEASWVHLEGLREDPMAFGPDVRERLLVGLAIPAERYVRALSVRRTLARRAWDLFRDGVDVLATPTTPIPAPRLGQTTTQLQGQKRETRALLTRFTNPFNLLGLPALSVPCGLVDGLPVGLQLVGGPGHEATVLAAGWAFERARGPFPTPRV
jgi:aspartyl-tRNA(Asn)/glutamyl-tRNA(Gln) amidotransferase subunit A